MFSTANYFKSTWWIFLEINNLKENDKSKKYIELDKERCLGDYLLSNMGTLSSVSDNQNQTKPLSRARGGGHRVNELERNQLISDFLNGFGITVNLLNDYDGELSLFDALNRVINAKNASEITDSESLLSLTLYWRKLYRQLHRK